MRSFARRFFRDERGATAIEYGLICALIALVLVGTFTTISTRMNNKFNVVSNKLT